MKSLKEGIYFLIVSWLAIAPALAQHTVITGVVRDSENKETLPFVNIFFVGTTVGVTSDIYGRFTIETDKPYTQLQFSFVGYKTEIKALRRGERQVINVNLESEAMILEEVVVRSSRKERYRNKNNPAVNLIRKVIDNKSKNQIESHDFVEFEQYEKLEFSLSSLVEKLKNKKLYKKYKFFFDNIDTTKLEGKSLLPIYLQETISQNYYRKNPEGKREIIKAHKKVSFDDYIDNQGLSTYLNHLYQNIDIYDNNITVLTNQFLSPISEVAPLFYKFYLNDTLIVDNVMLYELMFVPRNDTDFLFQGMMYITMDDRYAVQGLDMGINKNINLNWVRDLHIQQNFERSSDERYHLVKSTMMADFSFTKEGGGIFGERTVSVKDFILDKPQPDSLYNNVSVVLPEDIENKKDEQYWAENRHDSLTKAESKVYANIDSLQKIPSFRRTMDIATLLLAGYKGFGPWELGPVNTFYSFNPVEGFRLRAGGRTTPKFNEHMYLESYVAYGFKDEHWKYYFGGTYSFTGKSPLEFPVRSFSLSYQRETKIPGQELQFVQEDNFLLSFKRGVNDKWLYNKISTVSYLHEFKNHFSYRVGVKNWIQEPAGGLSYVIDEPDGQKPLKDLTTSELSLELRWAPNEQFYQGKLYRIPIPNKYPIVTARLITGVKDLFDGQYNYQNVTLNFYKRFYLSQLGYTDIVAEGGYIFGKVPYPLLAIHRANQTYSYQLQAYNLMNFLEFVSDEYVSIHFDHYFNGFFFNKIPLLKKLKLREVATVKVLYGGIRDENLPTNTNGLIVFPNTPDGLPVTYSLEREPYVEASVGIANIFKFFRIDVVKRLNYLDNPSVSEWGIRGRFKFDF